MISRRFCSLYLTFAEDSWVRKENVVFTTEGHVLPVSQIRQEQRYAKADPWDQEVQFEACKLVPTMTVVAFDYVLPDAFFPYSAYTLLGRQHV